MATWSELLHLKEKHKRFFQPRLKIHDVYLELFLFTFLAEAHWEFLQNLKYVILHINTL